MIPTDILITALAAAAGVAGISLAMVVYRVREVRRNLPSGDAEVDRFARHAIRANYVIWGICVLLYVMAIGALTGGSWISLVRDRETYQEAVATLGARQLSQAFLSHVAQVRLLATTLADDSVERHFTDPTTRETVSRLLNAAVADNADIASVSILPPARAKAIRPA